MDFTTHPKIGNLQSKIHLVLRLRLIATHTPLTIRDVIGAIFRLLALAALLAVIYADSISQPIKRVTRLPATSVRGLIRPQWSSVRRHKAQRFMTKTGSQPFIDYYDDFYLGNITIGTPSKLTVLP